MLRFCSCVFALVIGFARVQAATSPPEYWKLPPLDGELAGEFTATMLGASPTLNWKLKVRTEKPRERAAELGIIGRGLRMRIDARVDPAGEGTWRLEEAEINLEEWFHWLV